MTLAPPFSHPSQVVQVHPSRPAVIDGDTDQVLTYLELEGSANRWAHLLREHGIGHGSQVAVLLPNVIDVFPIVWALQRSGVEFTPINYHLTVDEVAQILNHSRAAALISTGEMEDHLAALTPDLVPRVTTRLLARGDLEGWTSFESVESSLETRAIPDGYEGAFLYYSSGSTGTPKGIRRAPLGRRELGDAPDTLTLEFLELVGFGDGDVYMSSAPLYHSAPLGWAVGVHRRGGTVVFTRKFVPEQTLHLIEQHRVTHCQMVPTMFVRILKMSADVRAAADISSLRAVIHSAAPCPQDVKRAMIAEWGPMLFEYYTSTELIGATFIDSHEWLAHPGSVGRSLPGWGAPRIVDADKNVLPPGQEGELWFEGDFPFSYIGDDAALSANRDDARGWATAGDIGRMDDEGFIYLSDRKAYMIISGGVNIYPQDIESVLVLHPKVADVAVFGVPNPDFGEEVKAVVQPAPGIEATDGLAAELESYCRKRLAGYKVPRSFDFMESLPRLDTGKLYKAALRDPYWVGQR